MDVVAYLTTPTGAFGGLAWAFFVVEAVAALAGIYLVFLRQDTHPIRGAALRRLGLALLVLGGLGVLFGALRLAAVGPFTMPIWFYLVALLEVVLAAYALYYGLTNYPAQMADYEQSTRSAGSRRVARPQPALQTNGNGGVAYSAPRPAATTGRRDARRDRKRRAR
jgi:hypothetical protein